MYEGEGRSDATSYGYAEALCAVTRWLIGICSKR